MAIKDMVYKGTLRRDAGTAFAGATTELQVTAAALNGAGQTPTVDTDANGVWTFTVNGTNYALTQAYDVHIDGGASDRYISYNDQIVLAGVDTGSLKIRAIGNGDPAILYFLADQAADAGDIWRVQATDSDTLAIGSDKAVADTIIDYFTIKNGANAAASVTTILGTLELGHATDTTIARSGSGDITIEGNAVYRAGGTDVPVADGGTGASSLTDGGVLLGSGTSAITAMGVLSDGQMIVGDGSTDPVAESGATLRTSIGVGTGDSPQFTGIELGHASDTTIARSGSGAITVEGTQVLLAGAALTGSTIDAGTDFTVGDTVITDGVITDSSGLSIAAAVDLGANTLTSTGSMQIRTIDYSDGDVAITIADGGGITAAAGITSTAAANALGASSFAGDVAVADSKFIEFESAAGTPTTDNTVQGIVIEFLAVEAITQFDAVYVSTTTGRVGRADANLAAKMPVIGIAIEAQGSAGSSVRVLTHGVYRDDGGFGGNMTVGVDLYAPETPGTLTTTRPSDDGDLIQVIGVATGVRSAYINPSLDIIEHA